MSDEPRASLNIDCAAGTYLSGDLATNVIVINGLIKLC